ncbi:MAG: N-acetyl-gamma-glutamyl-phosphate reductase [Acidobacteriota bacterium]|nr:N-acetyl-gamma-glutamyl-phosphate reductase [Acidobacteriota bacterium]
MRAFSESRAGEPAAAVHPALRHGPPLTLEAADPVEAGRWADVLFLALPHGKSQDLMEAVVAGPARLIVDLSADFRLADPLRFARTYGEHRATGLLGSFTYALADLKGGDLEGKRLLAAPGCFATACLLALVPLARAGLLSHPPACFAVTGSTGAGVHPRRTTHHPVRAHNFFAYALEGHRHQAEVIDELLRHDEAAAEPSLIVHSAPLVRGIHLSARVWLDQPLGDATVPYREALEGRPFVHLLDQPPELAAVVGTNHAHLHAATRRRGRELICCVAIDNLVKGAAGQAVQGMNLALGLEETAGLEFGGIYPC